MGEIAVFSKGVGYSKNDLCEEGTPIILYGRLYTKYETCIFDVDTFVKEKAGSVYSKGGEVIVPASGETAEDISIASVVVKPGILLGGDLNIVSPTAEYDSAFLALTISSGATHKYLSSLAQGKSVVHLHNSDIQSVSAKFPTKREQEKIHLIFGKIDTLITLHQRKPYSHIQRRCNMLNEAQRTDKFCEYYAKWITVYKKGAIRQVTMDKYLMTQKWLEKLIQSQKEKIEQQEKEFKENFISNSDRILSQGELIEEQREELQQLTLRIEDVETLLDEVSSEAYDKAVDKVAEETMRATRKDDIRLAEDSKRWIQSPERKASRKEKEYAINRLDGLIKKIEYAMEKAVVRVVRQLKQPEKKKAVVEEIKKEVKPSIREKLALNVAKIQREEAERKQLNKGRSHSSDLEL